MRIVTIGIRQDTLELLRDSVESSLEHWKNKADFYRDEYCLKKFLDYSLLLERINTEIKRLNEMEGIK